MDDDATFLQPTNELRALVGDLVDQVSNFSEARFTPQGWNEFLRRGKSWADLTLLFERYKALWMPESNTFLACHEDTVFAHRTTLVEWQAVIGFAYEDSPWDDHRANRVVDAVSCSPSTTLEGAQPSPLEHVMELLAQRPARWLNVELLHDNWPAGLPLRTETVELFCEQTHQEVNFTCFPFSQAQCDALSTFRGKLVLTGCSLPDLGRSVLNQVAQNEGPTALAFSCLQRWGLQRPPQYCPVSLERALTSTTSLVSLAIDYVDVDDVPSLARGLEQNTSLERFSFRPPNDEWANVVRSLCNHPKLKTLELHPAHLIRLANFTQDSVERARVVADMLRENTVLCEIIAPFNRMRGNRRFFDLSVERKLIQPRLKVNRHRARVKVLLADTDLARQKRVVLAALAQPHVLRDHDLLRMLLQSFPEIVWQQYEDSQLKKKLGFFQEVAEHVRAKIHSLENRSPEIYELAEVSSGGEHSSDTVLLMPDSDHQDEIISSLEWTLRLFQEEVDLVQRNIDALENPFATEE